MTRPTNHLTTAGKIYPGAWQLIDEFRQDRGKGLPNWTDFCFLPMAGFYAIVSSHAQVDRLPLHLIGDVARLSALGTWRVSQGIYRLDATLAQALIDSPIAGVLPVEVLHRLPEYCIYVETPDYTFNHQKIHGFFTHLEWDVNTKRTELRFLMDGNDSLEPFVMHLGHWTVIEAIDRATSEGCKQSAAIGIHHQVDMDAIERLATELRPLISLLLYLCSEAPEFTGGAPGRPVAKKTKKGWRLFPPDKPKIIDVGKATGAALREALKSNTQGDAEGGSKRAHIRRGHWHGFWYNSDSGEKKFKYKWLSPIAVNVGR